MIFLPRERGYFCGPQGEGFPADTQIWFFEIEENGRKKNSPPGCPPGWKETGQPRMPRPRTGGETAWSTFYFSGVLRIEPFRVNRLEYRGFFRLRWIFWNEFYFSGGGRGSGLSVRSGGRFRRNRIPMNTPIFFRNRAKRSKKPVCCAVQLVKIKNRPLFFCNEDSKEKNGFVLRI